MFTRQIKETLAEIKIGENKAGDEIYYRATVIFAAEHHLPESQANVYFTDMLVSGKWYRMTYTLTRPYIDTIDKVFGIPGDK
jgi:hypothetical protein